MSTNPLPLIERYHWEVEKALDRFLGREITQVERLSLLAAAEANLALEVPVHEIPSLGELILSNYEIVMLKWSERSMAQRVSLRRNPKSALFGASVRWRKGQAQSRAPTAYSSIGTEGPTSRGELGVEQERLRRPSR
jgi:hypothetical protein